LSYSLVHGSNILEIADSVSLLKSSKFRENREYSGPKLAVGNKA